MTTLLLIRHGLTDAVDHIVAGTAPGVHLNAAGRKQALAVAAALGGAPLAAVFSSPLERALQTAAPIARPHGLEVQTAVELSEFEFGSWTGLALKSMEGRADWQRFNTARSVTRPPDGGELMLDVQQRAVAALLRIRERYPAELVAVVSHGDVIRAALQYFLGMPLDFVHRIRIDPCRISTVELTDWQPVVRQLNADSVL